MEKKEKLTFAAIKEGKTVKRGNSRVKTWNMYASKRLLKESGQVISDELQKVIDETPHKFYYYNKISDNNKGSIIIGLHSKYYEGWVYIEVNQKGEITEYETITEAKSNMK